MTVKRQGPESVDGTEPDYGVQGSEHKRPEKKWARMFEGWQAGVIVVGCAVLTAAVVVPRPVRPAEIPLPSVDWEQLAVEREAAEARVTRAGAAGLAYSARAVGEGLRRLGAAEVSRDADALRIAREDTERALLAWASTGNAEELLALRDVQAKMFVAAVRAWERDASDVKELHELGGGFLERSQQNRWLEEGRFDGSDRILELLFRIRFGRLLRLDKHPFAPSLNDMRLYYRFHIRHLERADRLLDPDALEAKAGIVTALADVDGTYPAQLALGIIAFQRGSYVEALQSFESIREAKPNGPWSLRVQNYFAASLRATEE